MENQRVRLSKAMLKSALLKLLKEKSLNQISILELCKTAQINRTTFYKYYGNQTDLLREIEDDFFARLDDEMKDILEGNPNALLLVLNYLYEQRETFCILVRALPAQEFAQRLYSIPSVASIFQGLFDESNYSETEAGYIRQFIFQGTFAVLCSWLQKENPERVEEIAGVLENLRERTL